MPAGKIALRDMIRVDSRFHRSIHLERDYYSPYAAEGYIVTRASREALSLLSRGVHQATCRAQCILGPYGSGKSALALYFSHLMSDRADKQMRERARADIGNAAADIIPENGRAYMTVLATGTRENMGACLVRGLVRSLQRSGRNELLAHLQQANPSVFESPRPSSRDVTAVFESLARLAVEKDGLLGVVVTIDELGKLLEHAAQYPEDGDVQVLQELAEASARSLDYPLWFVTVLHRSFQEYADRVGRRHQQEWARVQGRFYPVPFNLDVVDSLQLVAGALRDSCSGEIRHNKHVTSVVESCAAFAPKEAREVFVEQALASYPLHPLALLNLPAIFKRMGQNERSLFSFLAADEPHSLLNWSKDKEFDPEDPPFYRIPELCDYAQNTLVSGAPVPGIAQTWAEIEEAIARLDSPGLELDVLKTVALLSFIGKTSGIRPSAEVIDLALRSRSVMPDDIRAGIAALNERRFIEYSRYWNAYRLQEGGDISIAECLAAAETTLGPHSYTISVARDLCPSQPIVARRHSFRTGMLRSFEVTACDCSNLDYEIETPGKRDGKVLRCVVRNNEQLDEVISRVRQIDNPALIVAVAAETDELEAAARDIAALEWVRTSYANELRKDRVARRELSDRRLEAETAFRNEWERVFGPGSRDAQWFWRGEEQSINCTRDFAQLLSRACDETYRLAPEVQNELINRRRLTSQAAAARRNLVEAMLTRAREPMLGFGPALYPPERAIYESLLLRTGMHRRDENGVWHIHPPRDEDRGLCAAWSLIDRSIMTPDLRPKPVKELFDELTAPPYGIADGFAPVLLTAYLIVNEARTALYEGNSFVVELNTPVMERLMRRPETFRVVAYEVAGERAAVVERFARGFGVEPAVLPVVRYIYAAMRNLPDYTRKTPNLPPDAIAVRNAVDLGKSPERFLFVDLPGALGFRPFEAQATENTNLDSIDAFFSALNKSFAHLIKCYAELLGRIRSGVLSVFDVSSDSPDWRTSTAARAESLLGLATDTELAVLARRALATDLSEQEYLESIAAHIAGMPPEKWSRDDEDKFNRRVIELGKAVRDTLLLGTLRAALTDGEDGCLLSIDTAAGMQCRQIVRYPESKRPDVADLARRLLESVNGEKQNKQVALAALAEAARLLMTESHFEAKSAEDSDGKVVV